MPSTVDAGERTGAPPREWWQVWADRRAAWWAARPVLAARCAKARAVGLWVGLLWILGLILFLPELRLGLQAYVGCLWLVIAWFLLARTKSLTWSGLMRFFGACVPWSFTIGVFSTLASGWAGAYSVRAAGPSVAIAGITEETLKLLPVVLVTLLAPRRSTRFATVDWALLGIASGAAFLAVEEAARRTALMVTSGFGAIDRMLMELSGRTVPDGWVQFRVVPLPTSWTEGAAGFGGHAVMTGLLAALIGLGITVWRHARDLTAPAGRWWRVAAVLVPAVALWSAISDHALYNTQFAAGASTTTAGGTPVWLDPATSTIPWWLRIPWSLLGHGHGRPVLFILIILTCLIVDGHRLSNRPGAGLLGTPPPPWVTGTPARLVPLLKGRLRVLATPTATTVQGLTGLVWVTGRDMRLALAGFARNGGESRGAALGRGYTVIAAQRALRELAYKQIAAPVDTRRRRLVSTAVLLLLVLAALVVAPATAAAMSEGTFNSGSWLAGVLDILGHWWHRQPLGTQIAIGLGIAALIALSGGSLGFAFAAAGVLTWGLEKSHGIATFAQAPAQATRNYFLTATPAQLAADTLGVVLTFAPGNLAGAAATRGLRAVGDEIAADPTVWLARRRSALAGDTGEAQIGALLGRHPIPDGAAALAAQREGISKVFRTFPSGADDATKAAWYRQAARAAELPDHMRPVLEGKAFHHEVYGHFQAHEVTINQLGSDGRVLQQFRVDGLARGEVISVKHTQIADIHPDTARRHINEMLQKYNPGDPNLTVAATTGNQSKVVANLLGAQLKGDMVLGVPAQHAPVPQWFIEFAAERGVAIRELTPYLPGGP